MSRSGVGLAKECIPTFEELKLGKKLKYIIYKLSDNLKNIEVAKSSDETSYEAFLDELPADECRYAIYDFQFELEGGEGTRNKICFYTWAPGTATTRGKMVYASSKDALRRTLQGVQADIQATDFSEVSHEVILERFKK